MSDESYICESCGKEHDGSYGSGRFCSVRCAKKRSISTRNKIKASVKQFNNSHIHIIKCIDCGKEIEKLGNVSKARCDKCKNEIEKCKICGASKGQCKRKDICRHNFSAFNNLIKYFGLDKNALGTERIYQEFDRIKRNVEDLYWNKNLSSSDLAKYFGYSGYLGNFDKILTYFIDLRTATESTNLALKQGKLKVKETTHLISSVYENGWHTTWNNKRFFYRSSYELEFCRELDSKKIDYEMESLRIEYWDSKLKKNRIAIPDFLLIESNTIVEIKSKYTLDRQNMNDKFKAYKNMGYNVELICDHTHYNSPEDV